MSSHSTAYYISSAVPQRGFILIQAAFASSSSPLPNSAAAERVFSLLKLFFGDARDSSLADMIQATLMLMYNKRATGHA